MSHVLSRAATCKGVLAAHLTEAGIIGLVGPVDAGDAKLHVDAFHLPVCAIPILDIQIEHLVHRLCLATQLAVKRNTHLQSRC